MDCSCSDSIGRGFTLMDLVVTFSALTFVAAVVLSVVLQSRTRARWKPCAYPSWVNNVRQVSLTIRHGTNGHKQQPTRNAVARRSSETKAQAFTLLELLIVIALLIVLAALLFPTLRHARPSPNRFGIQCVNNLRQVGLAFRVWQSDHDEKFPMQVSVTNGGAMEFVGGPEMFRCFEVMSNELCTPKILYCPRESDQTRWEATVFGKAPSPNPSGFFPTIP